jgi:hypothetical protein
MGAEFWTTMAGLIGIATLVIALHGSNAKRFDKAEVRADRIESEMAKGFESIRFETRSEFAKVNAQLSEIKVEQARIRVEVDSLNSLMTPFAAEAMKQAAFAHSAKAIASVS